MAASSIRHTGPVPDAHLERVVQVLAGAIRSQNLARARPGITRPAKAFEPQGSDHLASATEAASLFAVLSPTTAPC
jgi:hypothetical protein